MSYDKTKQLALNKINEKNLTSDSRMFLLTQTPCRTDLKVDEQTILRNNSSSRNNKNDLTKYYKEKRAET